MEFLYNADTILFFFINQLPHTWYSNTFALIFSGIGTGGFVWIFIGCVLIYREEKRDHWFLVPLGLITAWGFLLSEILLKNVIARIRPEHLYGVTVVGSTPLSFSFPSTHATMAFAFALLLSTKERKWWFVWYGLAIAISLSRIYLGHHYPVDVAGGAVLGSVIGYTVNSVYNRMHDQLKRTRTQNYRSRRRAR